MIICLIYANRFLHGKFDIARSSGANAEGRDEAISFVGIDVQYVLSF